MTFKLTQGHWYCYCSTGTYDFPLVVHCSYLRLVTFLKYYQLFPKIQRSRDPEYIPSGVVYHVHAGRPTRQCQSPSEI